MKRNIIQIAGTDRRIFALASDGTLWEWNSDAMWTQHDCLPQPTEELEEKMTRETFENVINQPATFEEISASKLAEAVLEHPLTRLILKRIVNGMLSNCYEQTLEETINEAVINHPKVDPISTLLDIKLRD
jgi:alpha-tubulin suppressor-like RCC1 family protein